MQRPKVIAFVLAVVLALAATPRAFADPWYAGNQRISVYGAGGTIFTPAGPPTLVNHDQSGEYSWIGTNAGGGWIQTGWAYIPWNGLSPATQYTEWLASGLYSGITPHGTQCWGCAADYKVDYTGSNTWYAYINGVRQTSGVYPIPGGITAQALLEVHYSSSNQASTYFKNIAYKTSSGSWKSFDQANWIQDSPYRVNSTAYKYHWTSYGP